VRRQRKKNERRVPTPLVGVKSADRAASLTDAVKIDVLLQDIYDSVKKELIQAVSKWSHRVIVFLHGAPALIMLYLNGERHLHQSHDCEHPVDDCWVLIYPCSMKCLLRSFDNDDCEAQSRSRMLGNAHSRNLRLPAMCLWFPVSDDTGNRCIHYNGSLRYICYFRHESYRQLLNKTQNTDPQNSLMISERLIPM